MDSEELVSRYKLLPIAARLAIATLLGIFPAYYSYLEEGEAIDTELSQARDQLTAIEVKFERERKKRNKLPELEAKLAFTEQQLKESSKRLPDNFFMNDVLRDAASLAGEVGVDLRVFDPGTAIPGGQAFKYMELPIEIEVVGRYPQIAGFYDRLANMEKMVHVRGMRLAPYSPPQDSVGSQAGRTAGQDNKSRDAQGQRQARQDLRIVANASMVIYRAMTPEEERSAAPTSPTPNSRPNGAAPQESIEQNSAPQELPQDSAAGKPFMIEEKIAVGLPFENNKVSY